MKKLLLLIVLMTHSVMAVNATAIRAPQYDFLNIDVNHVALGTVTNVRKFEYVVQGEERTCAVEISINVEKDRKNVSTKLKLLTTQTAIEYVVGREYLFISSENSFFDEVIGNQNEFDCSFDENYQNKRFPSEYSTGCGHLEDEDGLGLMSSTLFKLPIKDKLFVSTAKLCYRENNFNASSNAYKNLIIETRQMIFPVDEVASENDGFKWVSINPRWWFLFDIDIKSAVNRKNGSRNEFTQWEPSNMTRIVYEVADVEELVNYLFPANSGNWLID